LRNDSIVRSAYPSLKYLEWILLTIERLRKSADNMRRGYCHFQLRYMKHRMGGSRSRESKFVSHITNFVQHLKGTKKIRMPISD